MRNKPPIGNNLHTIARLLLAGLLAAGFMSQARAEGALPRSPCAQYNRMVDAAQRCQVAERVIYLHKQGLGLFNTEHDPNRTGMIGSTNSITTTTPGTLSAKRTAANPDFAAWLVRELSVRGVSSNDSVLVTMTGSLPGLNLALIIALDVLDIPHLRIASLGSSSFGANQPEMTWLDMEDILHREGLIVRRSDYATLGGSGDAALKLSPKGREILRKRCLRLGYPLLESTDLETQQLLRREILGEIHRFALVVNVGGNHLMLGNRDARPDLPGGWIDPESYPWQEHQNSEPTGLVFDYFSANVPVLNLLHVDQLCKLAGVPYDPEPLPRVGTSPVYFIEASP